MASEGGGGENRDIHVAVGGIGRDPEIAVGGGGGEKVGWTVVDGRGCAGDCAVVWRGWHGGVGGAEGADFFETG